MKGRFAVAGCAQIVTLRGPARPRVGGELSEIGLLRDAGLIVRDGRIETVGPWEELRRSLEPETPVIDAEGRTLTPGFVDAHTHAVFAGSRANEYELRAKGATYQEIAERGGGILSSVRAVRAAGEEALLRSSLRHAQWMLRSGTTTAEIKSGYGLSLADELKMLRVARRLEEESPLRVVTTFLGAHAVPSEFAGRTAEYETQVIETMLPAVARESLAAFCDIFVEDRYFDADSARRVMARAKALGLRPRLHVDQLRESGGAALAAELGAKTADHLEHTGPEGIAALARAGVQPVLLPGSVYALGHSKYPDARAMIEAGLAVVLATDFNPGSSPTPSIPAVLSLACTQMRMTPAEAMTAATINAAYSLDRGDTVGSLEPGKQADFVLWDVPDYREIPYFFGVEHAAEVYVGGRRAFTRVPR